MKTIRFASLILLGLISCKSSTEPMKAADPIAESISYDVQEDTTSYIENVSITPSSSSTFTARWSGGRDSLSESYDILNNGDLYTTRDSVYQTDFPISSHGTWHPHFLDKKIIVTEKNGYFANGYISYKTEYLGEESIVAAGRSWKCAKIKYTLTTGSANGKGPGEIDLQTTTRIYWYSPELRFFVRIDDLIGDKVTSSKVLKSHK